MHVLCVDDAADELPMPSINGAILQLVVDYMNEHKGVEPPIIPAPLRSSVMKYVCLGSSLTRFGMYRRPGSGIVSPVAGGCTARR